MSGSFVGTGSYSNLTRLELEQLRRADFGVAGKALTTGDASGPNANVNAESFASTPFVSLSNLSSVTPPASPGDALITLSQVALPDSGYTLTNSETVQWFGPRLLAGGGTGHAITGTGWETGINVLVVPPGSTLYVKKKTGGTTLNSYAKAIVSGFTSTSAFTLTSISNPTNISDPTALDPTDYGDNYGWFVITPGVVQLYAVPGSGPLGQEQAFLFVKPVAQNTGIHADTGLNLTNVAAQRIRNVVPPTYGVDPSFRSDALFPAVGGSISTLGYRVVLYPDDGTGTGPNLATPINALNPLIDGTNLTTFPAADQRMTIDYAAGVIRFSTPPTTTGEIKKPGGVHPTTSRLNLYATFWAVDQTGTLNTAESLFASTSSTQTGATPATIKYTGGAWQFFPKIQDSSVTAVSHSGTPSSLSSEPLGDQIGHLLDRLNDAQKIPLLDDPAFAEFNANPGTYPGSTSAAAQSHIWTVSPAASWQLSAASGVYTLKYTNPGASESPTLTQTLQRSVPTLTASAYIWISVTLNVQTPLAVGLNAKLIFINGAGSTSTATTTLLAAGNTCNFTSPRSNWINNSGNPQNLISISVEPNSPLSSGSFEIQSMQAWIFPAIQNAIYETNRGATRGISNRVRFSGDNLPLDAGDGVFAWTPGTASTASRPNTLLTAGTIKHRRADSLEASSALVPAFESRGAIRAGGGLTGSITNANLVSTLPGTPRYTSYVGPSIPSVPRTLLHHAVKETAAPLYSTVLTSTFTQPAVGSTAGVTAVVASSSNMGTGDILTISNGGFYRVQSVTDSTHVVLMNLGYTGNLAPGTLIAGNLGNLPIVTSIHSGDGGVRTYSFETSGPYQSETTINARWSHTLGRWVKDEVYLPSSRTQQGTSILTLDSVSALGRILPDTQDPIRNNFNLSYTGAGGSATVFTDSSENFLAYPPVMVGDLLRILSGSDTGESVTITSVTATVLTTTALFTSNGSHTSVHYNVEAPLYWSGGTIATRGSSSSYDTTIFKASAYTGPITYEEAFSFQGVYHAAASNLALTSGGSGTYDKQDLSKIGVATVTGDYVNGKATFLVPVGTNTLDTGSYPDHAIDLTTNVPGVFLKNSGTPTAVANYLTHKNIVKAWVTSTAGGTLETYNLYLSGWFIFHAYTFNVAMASTNYVVVATADYNSGTNRLRCPTVTSKTTTGFLILLYEQSGSTTTGGSTDGQLNIIVIGEQ